MFTLLAVGTVLFWIAFTITTIIIIGCLESNNGSGATLALIIFLLIFYFLGGGQSVEKFFTYIVQNPGAFISYVFIYLLIGMIYSFIKWYFHVLTSKEDGATRNSYEIQAKYNKGRIISWMSYWPFSLCWTLIDQPIKRSFNFIYMRASKVYDKITDHIYRDVEK